MREVNRSDSPVRGIRAEIPPRGKAGPIVLVHSVSIVAIKSFVTAKYNN